MVKTLCAVAPGQHFREQVFARAFAPPCRQGIQIVRKLRRRLFRKITMGLGAFRFKKLHDVLRPDAQLGPLRFRHAQDLPDDEARNGRRQVFDEVKGFAGGYGVYLAVYERLRIVAHGLHLHGGEDLEHRLAQAGVQFPLAVDDGGLDIAAVIGRGLPVTLLAVGGDFLGGQNMIHDAA